MFTIQRILLPPAVSIFFLDKINYPISNEFFIGKEGCTDFAEGDNAGGHSETDPLRGDYLRGERLAVRATKEMVHVLKFSNRYEP